MSKDVQVNLLPALSGYPVVMAFNRYIVTRATPYVVATCGLVSDDGELLSSFSFSINKEMSPSNADSVVKYLNRTKGAPEKPEHAHRGIRMPQGGVTIPHAALLNAGSSDNLAEIRLENYVPSALRNYPFNQEEEATPREVKSEAVALLRSSFDYHYHLLAEIYTAD